MYFSVKTQLKSKALPIEHRYEYFLSIGPDLNPFPDIPARILVTTHMLFLTGSRVRLFNFDPIEESAKIATLLKISVGYLSKALIGIPTLTTPIQRIETNE